MHSVYFKNYIHRVMQPSPLLVTEHLRYFRKKRCTISCRSPLLSPADPGGTKCFLYVWILSPQPFMQVDSYTVVAFSFTFTDE